jgi:putative DNA primase/helicase
MNGPDFEEVARRAKADANRAPPRIVSALELLALDLPPREMVLVPVLPSKGIAMLYGPRGLGKTHVALGIAWAAASSGTFLKWRAPVARRVLYVDGEMPQEVMQERVARLAAGDGPNPTEGMLRFQLADMQDEPMPDLATLEGQAWLERHWGEPPDLLILDNLSCLAGAVRDNEADSWSPMQSWLLSLRRRGVTVLIVHHAGKGGQQRGTSRREDVLDTVIALRRPADYSPAEGARFEVHFEKARGARGEELEPFEAMMHAGEDGGANWTCDPLEDVLFKKAVALFLDGTTVRDAAEALGLTKSAVGRLRKRAVAEGLIPA